MDKAIKRAKCKPKYIISDKSTQFWPNNAKPEELYAQSPPLKFIQDINNCELPKLELNISYLEGRKHLPIVEIKKAA